MNVLVFDDIILDIFQLISIKHIDPNDKQS